MTPDDNHEKFCNKVFNSIKNALVTIEYEGGKETGTIAEVMPGGVVLKLKTGSTRYISNARIHSWLLAKAETEPAPKAKAAGGRG